jgi:hypothetical protein
MGIIELILMQDYCATPLSMARMHERYANRDGLGRKSEFSNKGKGIVVGDQFLSILAQRLLLMLRCYCARNRIYVHILRSTENGRSVIMCLDF